MIVDTHVHFTQAPPQLDGYRGKQVSSLNKPVPAKLGITDEELRLSLEGNLAQMRQRRIDRLMFPRAGEWGTTLAANWSAGTGLRRTTTELRACATSTHSPSLPSDSYLNRWAFRPRLHRRDNRCVLDLGFVGFNINLYVSGGLAPLTPSLGSDWWYPLWDRRSNWTCLHAFTPVLRNTRASTSTARTT